MFARRPRSLLASGRSPATRRTVIVVVLLTAALGLVSCAPPSPPTPPSPGPSTVVVGEVEDAIQEWWIGPVIQNHGDWYSTAALNESGGVEAIDLDADGSSTRADVATVPIDDHNVPARATIPGRGSLMQWTHHGAEESFSVVVAPGSGRAETFEGRPETRITIGSKVSYGQLLHLSEAQTEQTDTFWVLLRNDLNWGIAELVVDWTSGEAIYAGKYRRLVSFPEQAYMTSTFDDTASGTVRIAAAYNPAAGRNDIYLLELDLRSGVLTDLMRPTTTHDITSSDYLDALSLTSVLEDSSGTRRLLDVRAAPEDPAVLTVEYPGDVSGDGIYTETAIDAGGAKSARTFGKTGRHLDRYPCGAAFGSEGSVWHCGESGGSWSLSRDDEKVLDSTAPLFRPMPTTGGAISTLVGRVTQYTDYMNWSGSSLLALAVR